MASSVVSALSESCLCLASSYFLPIQGHSQATDTAATISAAIPAFPCPRRSTRCRICFGAAALAANFIGATAQAVVRTLPYRSSSSPRFTLHRLISARSGPSRLTQLSGRASPEPHSWRHHPPCSRRSRRRRCCFRRGHRLSMAGALLRRGMIRRHSAVRASFDLRASLASAIALALRSLILALR